MKVTILPLEPQASTLDLQLAQEACGLPLMWASDWNGLGTLKLHLGACYGFPMFEMSGGTIAEDGTYSYPEDSDMLPLAKVEYESVTYYQYDCGIIAFVTATSTFITRMD